MAKSNKGKANNNEVHTTGKVVKVIKENEEPNTVNVNNKETKIYTYIGEGSFYYKGEIYKKGAEFLLTKDEFEKHFKPLNLFK